MSRHTANKKNGCYGSDIKVAIVTTSWDDGHPLDMRLADLLASYNMVGTFYIPLHYTKFSVMTRAQMLTLRNMGMEIGSHTLSHTRLTTLEKDQALHELVESKNTLEDMLGG